MNPNSPRCHPLLAKYPSKPPLIPDNPHPCKPPAVPATAPSSPTNPPPALQIPPAPQTPPGTVPGTGLGRKTGQGQHRIEGCGQCRGQPSPWWLDRATAASYRAALTPGGRRSGQQGTGSAAETVPVPISTPILTLRPHGPPLCCSPRRGSKLLFNAQVDLQASDWPLLLRLVTLEKQGTGTGSVAARAVPTHTMPTVAGTGSAPQQGGKAAVIW